MQHLPASRASIPRSARRLKVGAVGTTTRCWPNYDHLEQLPQQIRRRGGLFGALVTAWLTGRRERLQRQASFIRSQLAELYSPMVACHTRIRAATELRNGLSKEAHERFQQQTRGRRDDPEASRLNIDSLEEELRQLRDEHNRRLREDLMPLYVNMRDLFASHLWLVEPETSRHLGALVQFVEVWERELAGTIPEGVRMRLQHSEDALLPLYSDLERDFARLCAKLRK